MRERVREGVDVLRGIIDVEQLAELVAETAQVLALAPLMRPQTNQGTPFRCSVSAAGDLGFWSRPNRGYHYYPNPPKSGARALTSPGPPYHPPGPGRAGEP